MIDDRFKEERRKKLSARLKRYLSEFSSCAHEWATLASQQMKPKDDDAVAGDESSSLLSTFQASSFLSTFRDAMHNASRKELTLGGSATALAPASEAKRVPRCKTELATVMSLERDEWMSNTKKESMTSLFMPFANMHTQLLAALTDYSGWDANLWQTKQKKTAAEYASFILRDITDAWKKQVCRTVRLRHSLKAYSASKYRYSFVVLEPVWQPNAGQSCKDKCDDKTGWCNFCGGRGVGACCKRGGVEDGTDPSECKQFDVVKEGAKHPVCVHTDCAQSSSKYEKKWFTAGEKLAEIEVTGASACQSYCQTAHMDDELRKGIDKFEPQIDADPADQKEPATVFNFRMDGKCECLSGRFGLHGDLIRKTRKDYISGPVYCPTGQTVHEDEEQDSELPTVPMYETEVCEKSEAAYDVQDLEKQTDWIKQCSANATAHVVKEFNPFYQRFAKFTERLAWVSGCGDEKYDVGVAGYEEEDWNAIVDFPFGTFSECNWRKEGKRKEHEWVPDDLKKRGWLGQSRINMQEQAKMESPFPAPGWLVRLMKKYNCIDRTARSDVGSGKSAVVESIFSG